MCLAAPVVTGKGHRKIEPKAKHFSHCKKTQSSWPNQIDSSKRLAKLWNHAYNNSEKIQIILIDKMIINPQFIRSRQTHCKKVLHWIDLQEDRGELCIEIQRERRSHLANNYGPKVYGKLVTTHRRGYGVDVEALRGRCPLRRSSKTGPKMGSRGYRRLRRWN